MKIALLSLVLSQQQICLEPAEARYVAQYIERVDAENAKLKQEIKDAPSPALIAVIASVAGVLVGGAVGIGVTLATQKK
jgi:hypothetical protein